MSYVGAPISECAFNRRQTRTFSCGQPFKLSAESHESAPSRPRRSAKSLPRPLVVALVLLHALPLMLFAAALLPDTFFASRRYFTGSIFTLVTLSILVAWLFYATMLAPMASETKGTCALPPCRGIPQELEIEFQLWKSSTFERMQRVLVLVWAAWWQMLPQCKAHTGPALVPNLLVALFLARAIMRASIPYDRRLEVLFGWAAAIFIPVVNNVDSLKNATPESLSKLIDMEHESGSALWLPYIFVGVVLPMQPFSMRLQIGLLVGNGLIAVVSNLVRALYSGNWLTLAVRQRVVLSMWVGFALMQLTVLAVVKPAWVRRRREQVDINTEEGEQASVQAGGTYV